tara:strand:+ start:99 stop:518 length:420 start_codon:yes stop_codon:yes gene_type:complete
MNQFKNKRNNAFTKIELPSNKKFGYFFSGVLLLASTYFFYIKVFTIGYALAIISVIFFGTTLFNPNLLLPLNKLWMRLGILLGMIISPIVLGIIFFGILTPYGIIMRIFRRDQLRLKKNSDNLRWLNKSSEKTNFERQF